MLLSYRYADNPSFPTIFTPQGDGNFATGGDAPKLTEIFPTIFTPQGDGNSIAKFEGAIAESNSRQYLPRKGTETLKKTASEHKLLP